MTPIPRTILEQSDQEVAATLWWYLMNVHAWIDVHGEGQRREDIRPMLKILKMIGGVKTAGRENFWCSTRKDT
jgi:hypothetical protein